jgi:hypothetical protein
MPFILDNLIQSAAYQTSFVMGDESAGKFILICYTLLGDTRLGKFRGNKR